jgi:hypothetical protein
MKKVFLFFVSNLAICVAFAQGETSQPRRFDLHVNAGSTFTATPAFNAEIIHVQGFVIPGFIDPTNGWSSSWAPCKSTTRSQLGWHVEAEAFYRLPHNFSLSVGAGLKKMRFDTDTKYISYSRNGQSTTVDLDDLDRGFGENNLLYLSVTPLNISKGFFRNRFVLQTGPTFNFLLHHDVKNVLAIYNSANSRATNTPDEAYFDTIGNMRNLTWGWNLGASYKIIDPLSIKVSAQYYVSSIYEDKPGFFYIERTVRALTVQAGVSIAPFAF